MSMDAADGSLDGLEDLDGPEAADLNRPYGEVTAEDLATDELIGDGADAAAMAATDGAVPVDAVLHVDDMATEETIDERLAQEIPDPNQNLVYGEPRGDEDQQPLG